MFDQIKDRIAVYEEAGVEERKKSTCPLCQYNLMKNTPEAGRLPVIYFTELLAQALGVDEEAKRA